MSLQEDLLKRELNVLTKKELRERAKRHGFYDLYLDSPHYRVGDLRDAIFKRTLLMDRMKEEPDLTKLAKELGYDISGLGPRDRDELEFLIRAGGRTEEEVNAELRKIHEKEVKSEENERKKWEEVDILRSKIDSVRRKYRKDMRLKKMSSKKVSALILGLIDEASFRIGNETSAEQGVYGVSTLPLDAVSIKDGVAEFRYTGKKGVPQRKKIEDKLLLDALKEVKDWSERHPCGSLFCVQRNSKVEPIKDRDVRSYMEDLVGFGHTHRFRALKATDMVEQAIEEGKTYQEAVNDVSVELGHFRTVKGELVPDKGRTAEKSYIDPRVQLKYGKGRKSRNPVYHSIKKRIGAKDREEIIRYIRENPSDKKVSKLFFS